jgi:hypothetical protein
MIKKDVTQTNSGVKINFSGVVQKQNIVKMVQNCQTGQCECMSDETKSKIKHMSVTGEDGSVELSLDGDISSDEIQEALNRSKLL